MPGLSLAVTTKVRVWPDSSAGPAEIALAQPGTDCTPCAVWTGVVPVKLGASLTAVTVKDTVAVSQSPPVSQTRYSKLSAPFAFVVGV